MTPSQRAGQHVIARGAVLAGLVLLWSSCVFGLNPALNVNQYGHTSWKIRDGFPKGQITSIVQTPDGYLWLGTEFGLVRFDGIRNRLWLPPAGQQLPSNFIFSLLVAHDGTLWIGTGKGVASWKDGKLNQHPEMDGQYVFKLLEDHEGAVWASGLEVTTGRLCAFRNGSVECHGEDGILGRGAFNLYEDHKGNLWAGVRDGLWRWKPGKPEFYPLPDQLNGIQALGEDDDGALLVGWRGGIQRLVNGKTEPYRFTSSLPPFQARKLLRDRNGGLWIGTADGGLIHVHQGMTDLFTPTDGLSGGDCYSLFEDREGNIWITTQNGFDRFRDFAVTTLTTKQGLLHDTVGSVLADRDGSVWLSTYGGLNKWSNGLVTIARTGSGNADGKLNGNNPNSLFQDESGRLWVSTHTGFGYLDHGQFVSINGFPAGTVNTIAEDKRGYLWVGAENFGLLQVRGTAIVQQIPWVKLGHKDHASALAIDRLQGGLWLGFHSGGIAYYSENQIRSSYVATDGLGAGRINQLRFDREGVLWAATDGGLSRLKNGRPFTLNSKSGLSCDTIHWTIEDDAHSFWLYTACGLLRVAHSDLEMWETAVDQGKDPKQLQFTLFDSSDGVRILSSAGHFSSQITKSVDGRLWFSPGDGVSVLDPNHLPFNNLPPPVHIEQITADRKIYEVLSDESSRLKLPPLVRDLMIDYTALSFIAPDKIVFRYLLEGHDGDWQEAGYRRQAFYNDLPPGNYRFRVMACNNSGVWNEAGTFLDFTIAPAYYQTIWFRLLVIVGFLLLVISLYHLRVRQVAGQVRARMEERLDERERIARDLHDTLLQGVQGLILKFQAVSTQIPPDHVAHEALEKTLDNADRILAEGRDRVRNLRAGRMPIGGLAGAFERVAEETSQGRGIAFKTVVHGDPRELHLMAREESYCIGREALINAVTHSGGRNVEIEIIYESRQFRLRVRDDGHGIDQKTLEAGGRSDHWGMQGMRERAKKIGAELKIWSGREAGTEVELIVPGATAYQAAGNKSRLSWFRRFLASGS